MGKFKNTMKDRASKFVYDTILRIVLKWFYKPDETNVLTPEWYEGSIALQDSEGFWYDSEIPEDKRIYVKFRDGVYDLYFGKSKTYITTQWSGRWLELFMLMVHINDNDKRLKRPEVQEVSEKFLVVLHVGGMSVIDGAEYFDTFQESQDYINSLPEYSGTEYTICRIYKGVENGEDDN